MWDEENMDNLNESIVVKVPTVKLLDIELNPSDNTKSILQQLDDKQNMVKHHLQKIQFFEEEIVKRNSQI